MRHQTVALIGGSGFIGRYLANALVAAGRQVRIATRRRAHANHLTMLPLDVIELDVFDAPALARFVEGADALINLVGTLHGERGNPYGETFAKLHVELPKKLTAVCVAKGVPRFIHVSALHADSNGPSMYLRSKGDGEKVVRAAATALATTLFRPATVFGAEDHFLNTFAFLQRKFPVIALAKAHAKFQPVYVDDVAHAIVNVLDADKAYGRTYELGGPTVYTLEALFRLCGNITGRPARIIRLPDTLAWLQALVFEKLPGELLTRDNLDSMSIDSVMNGPIAPELNIEPASIESTVPAYLSDLSLLSRFSAFRANAGR